MCTCIYAHSHISGGPYGHDALVNQTKLIFTRIFTKQNSSSITECFSLKSQLLPLFLFCTIKTTDMKKRVNSGLVAPISVL